MTLIAHPLAMPSTLHNKKRKGHHNHTDLLPSKKAALDPQAVTKCNDKVDGIIHSSELGARFSLPNNAVHENEAPHSSGGSSFERRKASMNAEVALYLHFHDSGSAHHRTAKHENRVEEGISAGNGLGNSGPDHDNTTNILSKDHKESSLISGDDNHNLRSEVVISTNDVSSKRSVNSKYRMSLLSHSVKQPSVVLTDYKLSGDKSPSNSLLVSGNYMRRMASLNARACVSAMMETDGSKKSKTQNNDLSDGDERDLSTSNHDLPSPVMTSPILRKRSSMLNRINNSFSSSSVTSSPGTDDSEQMLDVNEPQVYDTLLSLAIAASSSTCQLEDLPYNNLGLLYNGDTLHPNCRVFYASDTDLTIPEKVIPKVVPSREKFVASAVDDALSMRYVGRKKKAAKANNGWSAMGNPIKTIEYQEGTALVTRRYYAGIRRSNAKEVIYVRDSVIIRAGDSSEEEKPYVAKLASIWQEQPGQLMMTVVWYYRPDEMDSNLAQGTVFKEDELLASQHNDDNSVACIEEKCFVLGVSQYCRYQAYIHCKKAGCISKARRIVPPRLKSQTQNSQNSKLEHDTVVPTSHRTLNDDLEFLSEVDPGLVCLCHSGYNHCAGKLTSRAFSK